MGGTIFTQPDGFLTVSSWVWKEARPRWFIWHHVPSNWLVWLVKKRILEVIMHQFKPILTNQWFLFSVFQSIFKSRFKFVLPNISGDLPNCWMISSDPQDILSMSHHLCRLDGSYMTTKNGKKPIVALSLHIHGSSKMCVLRSVRPSPNVALGLMNGMTNSSWVNQETYLGLSSYLLY